MAAERKSNIVSNDPTNNAADFMKELMKEFGCVRVAGSHVLGPLGSVEGLLPHADEAGWHKDNNKNDSETVPMPKPQWWKDGVHEEDCVFDMVGERRQDGRQLLKDEMIGVLQRDGVVEAWDDVSGKYLDPERVAAAREAEMSYFRKMNVYTKVPRSEVKRTGGRLIGTRWIDVNKSDERCPDDRSR